MKYFLFILVFLSTFHSFGQKSVDLANLYWRVSPSNDLDSAALQPDLNTLAADVKFPWILNDSNIIIFGLQHQRNSISNIGDSAISELKFQSSVFQLGWEHKWNEKSKMLFMNMLRCNSSSGKFTLDNTQSAGLILGTTEKSHSFHWKYGLYFNSEFFGPMIVPLLGFKWVPNDNWRLTFVAPVNIELRYAINSSSQLGLKYEGLNSSYRLGSSLEHTYLDKADNNIWVYAEKEIAKNTWVHLKAGHSILRSYGIYLNGDQMDLKVSAAGIGDNRDLLIPVLENGFSFEFRFIYRLPI